ncbi:MAG: acetyl-CoA C-acyltransferase [Marine Group II euryarchaeote MED-G33]|nr:MAG: acetyl-CoA C-acyltransferase [Marine Group II euryarchaeote MED-G33]|tara:strand:- start:649 stop:1788 length:1140 start_codon:yes stop_codon:yes gene_type:complete
MTEVVICGVARTPVGKYRGALANQSAVDLGVHAVKGLLERVGIDPASGIIDDVLFGQVLQAGAGQSPARQVALGAGMPFSTPATTINKVCGSSLKAVMMAANSIRAGEYNVIVAGGMESMTNAPYFGHKISRSEFGEMKPTMIHDGLWDVYNDEHMGNTGETVSEEYEISRQVADTFAARSHDLALAAWNQGWMDFEVVPTPGLERDEGIAPGGNLSEMRSVFQEDGRVTAGNASQLSDGAAAVLVASREAAEANGWPILGTVLDYCTTGVEPARVMAAPIPAIELLLNRNEITIDDLSFVEHNEAFAAASCAVAKACSIPDDKINPHGGAVAIGHPLGATGARCLMTLINALRRTGGGKGIVTLCLGGGNAVAMLVSA